MIQENEKMALGKQNYILLIIGFILMTGGGSDDPAVFNAEELFSFRRITLAPIIVLFGFGFEIYAIMKVTKPKKEQEKKA